MRLKIDHWILLCLLLSSVFVMAPQPAHAQDACPALVQMALESMGDNCTGLGRNNACYGYTRVDSTFTEAAPQDFFSQPADRAGLAQLETIATTPLDLALDQWGIAVMNAQANVPGALPGQATVFLMMGAAELTNAVAPEDTLPEADPVAVEALTETTVFSRPADNASTITTLAAGTLLEAHGRTEEGDWLRVFSSQGLGWVRRDAVEESPALDELPVITEEMQAPMQSFQVQTAFDDVLCSEAPSLLAIQSPENLVVDLMANGVHIRLGSLIMLRTLPPGDVIQIMTIEGDVVLDPDTDFETALLPGFTTQRCLNEANDVSDDCEWTPPVPMTEEELIFAQTVLQALQELNLEGGALTINGEPVMLIDTERCTAGETLQHTVQPGDTLYGIGLQYSTSVRAIMLSNELADTTIVAGQQLTVICGAQTETTPPIPTAGPAAPGPAAPPAAVDCVGFQATSPLDGLSYGANTFYWDAPTGEVDEYRVTVSGEVGSAWFTTDGSSLSLTGDITYDTVGSGYAFSWWVEALVDGQVVCTTSAVNILRETPPSFGGGGDDETPEPPVEEIPEEEPPYYDLNTL